MGSSQATKGKNESGWQYHRNMFQSHMTVGKGGFGRVEKVTQKKSRQIFALKVMSKAKILAKRSVQSVLNQKQFLMNIDHNFIINMIVAFQDKSNLYLVMQYLNGGDLRHYINRKVKFTEQQIKFITRCLVEGLKYLNSKNIIHRDIKPENIVFEENGYCRITDLGVAREWRSDNSTETSGTPGYMAPEVMCKQNHSFCADYFGVGVIVYELMMGKRPYQGSSRKAIRDEILAKQVSIPEGTKGFSPAMIDFTNKLIQRKVRNRLGYNGVSELVEHPWIRMSAAQQQKFCNKKIKPSFQPTIDHLYDKKSFDSEPSQAQKQYEFGLNDNKVQQLFKCYDGLKSSQPSKRQSSIESTKTSTHNLETKTSFKSNNAGD